ncbi:amyloid-beta A4 precursor protein-binding family A member 2 isoform X12 [Chrysemys picta bellii]|uniref:amyloid-beta A4 precursor protein-binding family A member 2 isoform X12 n=1 Tax=Chrysemys picta bellii TaxID=8478 RepID=UPI0032B2549E
MLMSGGSLLRPLRPQKRTGLPFLKRLEALVMRHAESGAAGEEAVSAAIQLPGFISSLRVWLSSEAVTQKSWCGWSRSVCEEQEWRRRGGIVPTQRTAEEDTRGVCWRKFTGAKDDQEHPRLTTGLELCLGLLNSGPRLFSCFLSDYTGAGIAGSREELSKTSHAVCNGLEQPRKQQRSDLNGPIDNNNAPETKKVSSFPSFVDVPGPCEPEDLIDGIIFAANYLGSTQLLSERNPSKNIRMMQAQEAVSRVKRMQKAAKIKKKATSEGDSQALTEVDLFISTQRIKVLNADTQETMMDHALRTISYIADIGNIVVLMARRRMPRSASQDCIETTPGAQEGKKQYKMICHVFESEDAQLIAQSIGQAFSVAYQEFLRANGINPEDLSQKEYSDIINTQEMYNDDLIHFSNSENCKELQLEKQKGEILGVVIVESGWGSILPTVILANMMNGGPAARSGKLSIGDQIMSINGTSLVGLPLATCQGIIKGLKNQTQVKLNIVSCPPVTTVLIKRPDLKYQLGFSVQNGIICSLMRGGIAERGGVRVGHRIIEINGQSVVATAHEKIVQALSNSVGEIHMKTMPAAMFRLLTGQETPLYI